MTTTTGQRKRQKGWRMQPGDICVTRPGPFGNWWRIIPDDSGERVGWWVHSDFQPHAYGLYSTKEQASLVAVSRFREDLRAGLLPAAHELLARLPELRDHRLLCYCAEGAPCHRHVLAELADR